ncbi:hypothetical protein WEI85_41195 [Actinomycetes bacterium KLBMP 9797]
MTTSVVLDGPAAIEAHLSESITLGERRQRGVRFVLCDPDNGVMVHCPVDDLPASLDPAECAHTVSVFAEVLVAHGEPGAMLVVLTRPGSAIITAPDRVWYHAAHQVCVQHGVRLLGVYLLTPNDQRELTLDDAI